MNRYDFKMRLRGKVVVSVAVLSLCFEVLATEVCSLLRHDFNEDMCDVTVDHYKEHLWNVRSKKSYRILQFDNPKYAETVYTRIISEIVKCRGGKALYENGPVYGQDSVMKFNVSDGYKKINEYDRSNFNYLILINVLNLCKLQLEDQDVKPLNDEFVESVVNDVLMSTIPAKKQSLLGEAMRDIKSYMNELDLYKFIMREITPTFYDIYISKLTNGKLNAEFKNKDVSVWNNMMEKNCPKEESKFATIWEDSNAPIEPRETEINEIKFNKMCDFKIIRKYNLMNDRKTVQPTPRGIYNFGNTSYFGATMQFLYSSWKFQEFIYGLAKEQRKLYEKDESLKETRHMALVLNDIFNTIGTNVADIGDDDIKEQQLRAYKRMKQIIKDNIVLIPELMRSDELIDPNDTTHWVDPAKLIYNIYKILEKEAVDVNNNLKLKFMKGYYIRIPHKKSFMYSPIGKVSTYSKKEFDLLDLGVSSQVVLEFSAYSKLKMSQYDDNNFEFTICNLNLGKIKLNVLNSPYIESCGIKKIKLDKYGDNVRYETNFRDLYVAQDDVVRVLTNVNESCSDAYIMRFYNIKTAPAFMKWKLAVM